MELTLRSGEKINNSLSVATIEAAIRSIDSAVVSRGNKKDKLALLKTWWWKNWSIQAYRGDVQIPNSTLFVHTVVTFWY